MIFLRLTALRLFWLENSGWIQWQKFSLIEIFAGWGTLPALSVDCPPCGIKDQMSYYFLRVASPWIIMSELHDAHIQPSILNVVGYRIRYPVCTHQLSLLSIFVSPPLAVCVFGLSHQDIASRAYWFQLVLVSVIMSSSWETFSPEVYRSYLNKEEQLSKCELCCVMFWTWHVLLL